MTELLPEPSATFEPAPLEPTGGTESSRDIDASADLESVGDIELSAELEPAPVAKPAADAEPAEDLEPSADVAPAEPDAPPAPAQEQGPFDGVPTPIRLALLQRGFTALTPVQTAALEAMASGRDLQITSQTGSGKTVALGLAMAPTLLDTPKDTARLGPLALVIAPTRELAAQVQRELSWLYAGLRGVKVDSVTGGTNVAQEQRRLQRRPAVVVGTPGRLLDHLRSGALDAGQVAQLVLDEADQMLDLGFRDELEAILAEVPTTRRTHLVSATFPREVRQLTERYQPAPMHIEGTQLGAAHEDVQHVAHLVHPGDRYAGLVNLLLLAESSRTLVFVRTRADATRLAERLEGDGFAAAPLSGELQQAQRTRTLSAFRNGTIKTLIATDVAARGLDIPDVGLVVQADPPHDGEGLIHRSGRTGRAGQKGANVLLVVRFAERRVRRRAHEAGIELEWRDIPGAATVRKRLRKSQRRRLHAALEDAAPSESLLDDARALLEERDPAQVVASLLGELKPRLPRAPFEVEAIAPRSEGGHRGSPRARSGPNRDAPRGGPRGAAKSIEAGYVRFSLNWGARSGANPRRILAVACRRGKISSGDVGAIRVTYHAATVEVKREAARAFEAAARRPDRREPWLRIEKATDR
ncbi:MAG: DEAD/DEAH box helicase [Planctomycetota bacterium]